MVWRSREVSLYTSIRRMILILRVLDTKVYDGCNAVNTALCTTNSKQNSRFKVLYINQNKVARPSSDSDWYCSDFLNNAIVLLWYSTLLRYLSTEIFCTLCRPSREQITIDWWTESSLLQIWPDIEILIFNETLFDFR